MKCMDAINFLLYSYFEVTIEDSKEAFINAAIKRAYRDASSHVLSVKKDKKEKLKQECSELIKDNVEKLLKSELEYAKFHKNLCTALKAKYNGNTNGPLDFTYGIAQKWVNMTLKYLCVMNAILKSNSESHEFCKEYSGKLYDIERCLHVPIDSFILEAAGSKTGDYSLDLKIPHKNENEFRSYSGSGSLPWSRWDPKDWGEKENYYLTFQKEIEKKCKGVKRNGENAAMTPLEWENNAWIEVAKKRKNSRKKD